MSTARIVEISEDGRHLALDRGFMTVASRDKKCGKVPLDDIGAVIVTGYGTTASINLLAALAARNAMFVLPGENFLPTGMIWPCASNYEQASRVEAQASAPKPLKKRLWQQIIKMKIQWQAAALEALGKPSQPLSALQTKVKSGDPDNIEAQAARRYWSLLFGKEFRRDRDATGINAQLNFGYAVIRSAAARAVAASGLHPSLGIHHANAQNAFRLADDFMEPFRTVIDVAVAGMNRDGHRDVIPFTKRRLVETLWTDFPTNEGVKPVSAILGRLAYSFVEVLSGSRDKLWLPPPSRGTLTQIADG